MKRSILIVAFAVILAVPLAGCGRKGMPYEPEDAVYPRVYPYTPQPGSTRGGPASGAPANAEDPDYQPPKPNLNRRNGY